MWIDRQTNIYKTGSYRYKGGQEGIDRKKRRYIDIRLRIERQRGIKINIELDGETKRKIDRVTVGTKVEDRN